MGRFERYLRSLSCFIANLSPTGQQYNTVPPAPGGAPVRHPRSPCILWYLYCLIDTCVEALYALQAFFFGSHATRPSNSASPRDDHSAPADFVGLPISPRWQMSERQSSKDNLPAREGQTAGTVDTWLHGFSGITIGKYEDSFPLEVRTPDMQVVTIHCKVTDSASSLKDKVAGQIGISPEEMADMGVYYFGAYMAENLPIGASECPWNGTHLELKSRRDNYTHVMQMLNSQ